MPTINVRTTQNVLIQYQVAGLWDRILAFFIDGLIFIAYLIIMGLMLAETGLMEGWTLILVYLPIFFYNPLFEILMNGQTPGKMALQLRVVRLDGESPTILNYLFRFLLWPVDVIMVGSVAITCIVLTPNGQRLGDIAGGTTVVKMKAVTPHSASQILKNMEEGYVVQFPQVVNLSDQDIKLIKEALHVNVQLGNPQPMTILTTKIKLLLGVDTDLPPVKFLYTIIKDYQHVTSKLND
ncbi:MAG: RDD family protein [Bacteroidetes bacterium]|nr:RDD family protein [Bacteroidota bacterium]